MISKGLMLAGKLLVGFLYTFVSLFGLLFAYSIITGYLLSDPSHWVENTDGKLTGLSDLWFPAFGMYIHWIGGTLILIIGLVQLFPFFRRPKTLKIHRILGTMYIFACIITSLGGNLFVYTHGCVGGPNMNVSFSIAGWIMFGLAVATYYHARSQNLIQHRDFAIRLWGQGIASLLYRVWYMLLHRGFGYRVRDAQDFHRPLDEFLDWWFFVPNLVVTEIVVWCIHRRDGARRREDERAAEAIDHRPLVENTTEDEQGEGHGTTEDVASVERVEVS